MSVDIAYAVFSITVIVAAAIFWVRRAMRHRHAYLSKRRPLTDDAFVVQMGIRPEDRYLCLLLREAFAEGYQDWPKEHISPDDRVDSLAGLISLTPFDMILVLQHLEKHLGIPISGELARDLASWRRDDPEATNREAILHMIRTLREHKPPAAVDGTGQPGDAGSGS